MVVPLDARCAPILVPNYLAPAAELVALAMPPQPSDATTLVVGDWCSLLLAIIVVAILGPGLFNTLIAITLALIPPFIRATYNAVHAEMQKEYIIASRLDGSPPLRIMRLAILPNIVETLVTQTTRTLSAAILDISAVGFLGLGAQSPQPEWGAMLADSSDLIYLAPWTVTLPGMAILFSVLVTNLVGEGIREALKEGND